MPDEPTVKRAIAFIDGQNLYHHAKAAFGHHHPNYDPAKLFDAVCGLKNWRSHGIRFYTGTPAADKDPMWHGYWSRRLLAMRRNGILVIDRRLRYYQTTITLEDGTERLVETPQEKGIDVRLALDVIRLARNNQLDVAVIFSQDQDLAEVADDVREISAAAGRWIKVACAFPDSPTATAKRGIAKTDWFRIDRALYDSCLDPSDYRPKRSSKS